MSAVPERHPFTHRGHQLDYEVHGSGGTVLVYLHGLLMNADFNRAIAERLAEEGNTVVLLDLLGHGRSDQPTHASEYRMDTYAEQVIALLDHLGVEQAVIGGLSLGANVSLFVAANHPERVRGLVIEMPVMEWAVPAAALMFVPMLLGAHYARGVLELTSAIVSKVPRTSIGVIDGALGSASTRPDVISAILHGVLVGPVVPTWEQRCAITAPALVISHRYDPIHPFDDADNLVSQLPAARLVLARSIVEFRVRPGRLLREIADFLRSLDDHERDVAPAD